MHRMKELSRTIFCGGKKTKQMMEQHWASLVAQAETTDAADKSSAGIDNRRKKSKEDKQKFFRRVLFLIAELKKSYRWQVATDVKAALRVVRSTGADVSLDKKEDACGVVNGLLGFFTDVNTSMWDAWSGDIDGTPYTLDAKHGDCINLANRRGRATKRLLDACNAEIDTNFDCNKELLCSPSIAQLVNDVDSRGLSSMGIGTTHNAISNST